jgi:hypothetical protein
MVASPFATTARSRCAPGGNGCTLIMWLKIVRSAPADRPGTSALRSAGPPSSVAI